MLGNSAVTRADRDRHRNLKADRESNARSVDEPIAALLAGFRGRRV